MSTLLWHRGGTRAPETTDDAVDEPNVPVWPTLAQLEVYTRSRRLLGWIAPEGERTSDWINRGHEIELIGPVEIGLQEEARTLGEPRPGARRMKLTSSDVLLAVPPALPPGRHLRLHRRVMRIRFETDEYDIWGRIHVRPGAEVGEYLLRSSRVFVPITDVDLMHRGDPAFTRTLPVVIVNSRHVARVHVIEGAAGGLAGYGAPAPATLTTIDGPVLEEPAAPTGSTVSGSSPDDPPPVAGTIHAALSELAALRRDGLVDEAEYLAKRTEILARL